MNYTKAMTVILAGIMAVSPMQFTKGESLKIAEVTTAVMETAEAVGGEKLEVVNVISDNSAVAGISLLMNEYFNSLGQEESGDIYVDGVKMKAVHRVPSPYENLAIANVTNYVNIRSGPSTDYEILGKLYNGCVANILGYEGDWVKIQSGNLEEGYICGEYLLSGWDAEEKIQEHCERIATVNCDVLNVRTGMSTSDSIYDKIPYGESYYVAEEYEEWVKIILNRDDNTGAQHTGYVYKEYVDLSYEFRYAITREEEAAKKAAEEAAKKAEEERLKKLAEEAAARKAAEEARKKAEDEARKAAAEAEAAEAKRLLEEQAALASDSAKLRQEVASYALNFIGTPYVWGGTSLTKGADCSGFVQSIYKQFGYTLPRVSRDQAKSAGYCSITPDPEHLLPGDLIFYANRSGSVDHVALYIGDGKIVHAATEKKGIVVAAYNFRKPYNARRVIQ